MDRERLLQKRYGELQEEIQLRQEMLAAANQQPMQVQPSVSPEQYENCVQTGAQVEEITNTIV